MPDNGQLLHIGHIYTLVKKGETGLNSNQIF
jgi:hypothetical protein